MALMHDAPHLCVCAEEEARGDRFQAKLSALQQSNTFEQPELEANKKVLADSLCTNLSLNTININF
ncbi:unnamed protein product [Clavelina lepadiformis]|uniref:Uncharacterized protein n=1 Tax=Clavelina lepadiformis TaxID=159417 RepID=A0ABP0FRC6_CLALP